MPRFYYCTIIAFVAGSLFIPLMVFAHAPYSSQLLKRKID